jgi:hypothetical protein
LDGALREKDLILPLIEVETPVSVHLVGKYVAYIILSFRSIGVAIVVLSLFGLRIVVRNSMQRTAIDFE